MTDFETYLQEQIRMHPSMQPQDIVKLCYQAAFGAEHLLQDPERAQGYFIKEYEETEAKEMPLYEEISESICRVNLAAWKFCGLPKEWLFRIFAASCGKREGGEALFRAYLQQAEAVWEGTDAADWQAYLQEYLQGGLTPVHHSLRYREQEKPAYRIVSRRFLRLLPILEQTAKVLAVKGHCVIAIDGRAASGKTTLAKDLQEILQVDVVQMDDFFLPLELRTAKRFAQPGGNVHQERFCQEVLPFLRGKAAFSYRIFNCSRMDYNGRREIGAGEIRLVEGSYSCHPLFGEYADVTVFSDIEAEEQMARILRRNGKEMAERFRECWIPMEEAYFTQYQVMERADIRLNTEGK